MALAVVAAAILASSPVEALNYPCSRGKGGAANCSGTKFVCGDGSISASVQKCTPQSVLEFRRQWEANNVKATGTQSGPPLPLASTPSGPTARVIDGDTVVVNGETFRLEGIDAPEMKQSCTDTAGRAYPCGRRAREALVSMIGAPVTCQRSGTDKYGRSLGYCTSGAIDLNRQMIIDGWAMAIVKYNDRYVGDEAAARASVRGIWAGKAQAPWDFRATEIAELAPTGKCVIKGNISHGQKTYYLPFHLMYARVKVDEAAGEKWFCTETEAALAGWRRADR